MCSVVLGLCVLAMCMSLFVSSLKKKVGMTKAEWEKVGSKVGWLGGWSGPPKQLDKKRAKHLNNDPILKPLVQMMLDANLNGKAVHGQLLKRFKEGQLPGFRGLSSKGFYNYCTFLKFLSRNRFERPYSRRCGWGRRGDSAIQKALEAMRGEIDALLGAGYGASSAWRILRARWASGDMPWYKNPWQKEGFLGYQTFVLYLGKMGYKKRYIAWEPSKLMWREGELAHQALVAPEPMELVDPNLGMDQDSMSLMGFRKL